MVREKNILSSFVNQDPGGFYTVTVYTVITVTFVLGRGNPGLFVVETVVRVLPTLLNGT